MEALLSAGCKAGLTCNRSMPLSLVACAAALPARQTAAVPMAKLLLQAGVDAHARCAVRERYGKQYAV